MRTKLDVETFYKLNLKIALNCSRKCFLSDFVARLFENIEPYSN
jgi:hypothetical protein